MDRSGSLVRWLRTVLGAIALALGVGMVQAQTARVSPDLLAAVSAPASTPPAVPWARVLPSGLHVQVLVNAAGTDPELSALRADILARGGSVIYNFISVRGLAAMVPAAAVLPLAGRTDVLGIAPNRSTVRMGVLGGLVSAAQATPGAGAGAFNGAGVGIAVLDSGIDWRHSQFLDAAGKSRVRGVVDIVALGRSLGDRWQKGRDYSADAKRSIDGTKWKHGDKKNGPTSNNPDPYGHGTHVAAMAAGSGSVAAGASLYDVRVLDERGIGTMADALLGMDWVLQRARLSNIRVVNLSLGAASTDSFLVDPLARAARSATAAGLVVVAAAGNAGKNAAGQQVLGTIVSPGHEPSVITVGALNTYGTASTNDDAVTGFSSRGPTRGALALAGGRRWVDNLVKPDLVAPGNKLVAAASVTAGGANPPWNLLAANYPQLQVAGAANAQSRLMQLSGASVAAPAVAGTAAVLLQVNPGLTPPLVKAILQYTALPVGQGGLLVQGTGQLNAEGATRLAQALRTDLSTALAAGTLASGANLLAAGQVIPTASSVVAGQSRAWSRLVTAGGNRLLTGDALFTRWQPIYDPGLTWARQLTLRSTVSYRPASNSAGVAANTVVSGVVERNALAGSALLSPGVRVL
ncbi:MAG: hypothetical protein RLZZ451_1743, partial [Pseudomonadota bacterium]